jgi:hypothetical protein
MLTACKGYKIHADLKARTWKFWLVRFTCVSSIANGLYHAPVTRLICSRSKLQEGLAIYRIYHLLFTIYYNGYCFLQPFRLIPTPFNFGDQFFHSDVSLTSSAIFSENSQQKHFSESLDEKCGLHIHAGNLRVIDERTEEIKGMMECYAPFQ